jgi:ribonucleoside-diphosphate reductase alpha chain
MSTRRILPNRRRSWTQKAVIGGTTCYLGCGEYDDGTLGELFLDVAKAGSALRATMDAFARGFSVSLQHGIPLESLVALHLNTDFAPQGYVIAEGSPVKEVKSIVDWAMQELVFAYLIPERNREEPE